MSVNKFVDIPENFESEMSMINNDEYRYLKEMSTDTDNWCCILAFDSAKNAIPR